MPAHQPLRDIINGRAVAIALPGHSLRKLSKYPGLGKEWCWSTINDYTLVERYIPHEIEVVIWTAPVYDKDKLDRFKGMIVTMNDVEGRVYRWTRRGGSTLYVYLQLLEECGVKQVYMFGADGFSTTKTPYINNIVNKDRCQEQILEHRKLCSHFNDAYPKLGLKIKVLNINKDSKYTLPSKTYEQFCREYEYSRREYVK